MCFIEEKIKILFFFSDWASQTSKVQYEFWNSFYSAVGFIDGMNESETAMSASQKAPKWSDAIGSPGRRAQPMGAAQRLKVGRQVENTLQGRGPYDGALVRKSHEGPVSQGALPV